MRQRYKFIALILGIMGLASCDPGHPGDLETVGCDTLERVPVLFVHGSGLDSRSFDTMISELRSAGYPANYLYAVDMVPSTGDNIESARTFIAKGVESLLSAAKLMRESNSCPQGRVAKVDIVAHSMGAFSSRWYAAFLRPDRVRRLISIAGANHGTNSLCGHGGQGNQQMCPAFSTRTSADDVQSRLNGTPTNPRDETPYGPAEDTKSGVRIFPDETRRITYFTISKPADRWIQPADSALLDGAGIPCVTVELSGMPFAENTKGNFTYSGRAEHDDLPANPNVIHLVEMLLDLRIPCE